jgi:hypothetical protein
MVNEFGPGAAPQPADRAFYYSAEGARIFEGDPPEGWYDHPSKVPDKPGEHLSEINQLRADYRDRFGKKPYMAWDEATLREKLAE